ncbi:MAG: DUF3592 domain-containing protein [Oscillospiraceae bacterium]|nr:DUF3592 domain-containing protein [Oscillospiraceae bacterium]
MNTVLQFPGLLPAMLAVTNAGHRTNRFSNVVTGIIVVLLAGGALAVMLTVIIMNRLRCKIPVTAKVARLAETTATKPKTGEAVTLYAPVYAYEYNGNFYEGKVTSYSPKPSHNTGETVQIKIDPENPEHYIESAAVSKGTLLIMLFLAGIAAMGMLLIFGT